MSTDDPSRLSKFIRIDPLGGQKFQIGFKNDAGDGAGVLPKQLDNLLSELYEQAKTFNNRALDVDWLFLYIEDKVLHLVDEKGTVDNAVHFMVIGVSMDARKELILSRVYWGEETADQWRETLLAQHRFTTRLYDSRTYKTTRLTERFILDAFGVVFKII
ncbi:MAG: hypothetical protein GKR87_14430 [Kiritimatiellae bacterium]|nr:hypothetical protein [Kiritimatiellia bacterium]NKB25544.1 hypothetical protein [Kiritimatiellia bacterium]